MNMSYIQQDKPVPHRQQVLVSEACCRNAVNIDNSGWSRIKEESLDGWDDGGDELQKQHQIAAHTHRKISRPPLTMKHA